MKAKEREWGALAYLVAILPLWGILFDGAIWTAHRESSRRVVFHAHQAIVLHFIMLLVFVFFTIFLLITKIVSVVDEGIANTFKMANFYMLIAFYLAYIAACIWGAFALLNGNADFEFPIIGSRLKKRHAEEK